MEVPFCSDSWFAHAGRLQELAIFWELRQQHGSVSDTLFPYGITLSQPFPPPANIYCVGCDVDRTVPYVSAALRYIRKRSLERGSDLWLENFDMRYRQVSWSHVADAQNEQSRLDEGSVPGSYQHPDGRTISGHHRPVLRGHEQHIQLLLDHGLMILPHSPDDSYINVVADTPFDLPVSQVNNPPMYFYPRPEIQDQTLLQAPVINSSQRVHLNRDLALSTENNGDAADTPMEPAGLQDISSKNNDFGGNTNSDANFKSTRPDLSPQTPSDPGRANDLSVVQHSIQHSNDSFGGSDHIFELHASFVPQITVSNTQTHETWEFGSTAEAADFLGVNHGTVVFARVSHGLIGGLYKISEADPLQLPRPKRVVVEVLNFRPDRRRLYASQGLAAQMLSFRKEEISRAIHSGRAIEEYERMYYVSYKEIAQTGHPPESRIPSNLKDMDMLLLLAMLKAVK